MANRQITASLDLGIIFLYIFEIRALKWLPASAAAQSRSTFLLRNHEKNTSSDA